MKTKWIALSFADDTDFLNALKWFDEKTDIAYELPGERDIIIPVSSLREVQNKISVAFTTVDVLSAGDLTPDEANELRRQWFKGKPHVEDESDG
jgi:hypothetical protein